LSAFAVGYAVRAAGPQLAAAARAQDATTTTPCAVTYAISPTGEGQFDAVLTITNTSGAPLPQWTAAFTQPGGQAISGTHTGQAAAQQASTMVHVSQQDQTVTVTSESTLDAGASVTQTLHGQHTGRPGVPGVFTLNSKRCDTTIILATTTGVTAASPAAATQVSTWDKPPGNSKPKKLHGKQPNSQRA
jgi:hypothetical protein